MACNFRNSDNFRYFKDILFGFEIDSKIFRGLHTVVHTFGGFVHTKVCGLVGFVNGYSMLRLEGVALDCIYPTYSIDDPALMTGLSPQQTLYVSIDAVNHSIEAATTVCTNPFAIMLAEEAITTVYRSLPRAMAHPDELPTRGELAYAAMLAGVSFDNGMLHLTHALEHPLSGVKPSLSHGLGLAILLPAVIEEIYPASAQTLAYILKTIVPGLAGMPDEAHKVALAVQQWIFGLGVTEKLEDMGFVEEDIDGLCDLVEQTPSLSLLTSLAPVKADRELVARIYRNSMRPMI